MKISLNTAQFFSNVDLKSIGRERLLEKIGAQLGAIDEVIDWAPKYEGVVIVRVVSCDDHPNADKLHICKIDDGGVVKNVERDENGYVQVVCGAPNVRQDLWVVWIPPSATVPATFGTAEPFVLETRELRGVKSNGMLASASELGLSDNHDGLLLIDEAQIGRKLTAGEPLVSIYGLDDVIIDVENKMFTHRPDCFGVLGVARELAGITGQAFKSPSWYLDAPRFGSGDGLPLSVQVDVPDLVPRFMAVSLKNVTIAPSPNWLQAGLTRIGIRPINNVVDITNWVMYVTGQPLHAYDYDKVAALSNKGAEIIVRYPKKDEKITLLSGKEITPRAEAIMIASPKGPLGLGGVMGGADTEVDASTKNIIVEVASFNMYSIRRTSMAHGLFTDAVTRFNKGQSPLQNDRVLAYAMQLLGEQAGAEQASEIVNEKDNGLSFDEKDTYFSVAKVNELLGIELPEEEIINLLTNVEFKYVTKVGELLNFKIPFWRTDISWGTSDKNDPINPTANADIAEEIGRLYGFDHLPLILPPRSAQPTPKDPLLTLKSTIRQSLQRAGANEVLTYSFVHGDLLKKVGQDSSKAFELSNALSPNLQYYRLSLTPSLLDKVHPNQKAGFDEFALFELGKAHLADHATNHEGVPDEFERLALVYAASSKVLAKDSGAAFFTAKNMLNYLAQSLKLELVYDEIADGRVDAPFDPRRSAIVFIKGGNKLGVVGEYTQSTIKNLKLPKAAAGFEIDTSALLAAQKQASTYVQLPKFPKVEQDISLRVSADVSYAELYATLNDALAAQKPANTYAQLRPLDIYTNVEMPDIKHVSFRLSIASYDETLKTEAVNALLDAIATTATTVHGAERL